MTQYLAPEPERPVSPGPEPSFSVVIPAYQAAETIGDALGSVLGQTQRPEEVIVCDDGSTDAFEAAVAPFADLIKIVRKSNGGGASALNAAVRKATSDFVVVCDSDDAYLPERISELKRLAKARPDLDVLSTDAYFEVDGRTTGRFNEANPFPVSAQSEQILRTCYLFAPALRRLRLVAVGGFDETLRIAYDWDCWIRLILDGATVGLVNLPLTRYRLREGSLAANRLPSLEERVTVLRKVASSGSALTKIEETALQSSLKFHLGRLRLGRVQAALLSRDPSARRRALELALAKESSFRTRLSALAAAIAPGRAARRLAEGSQEQATKLLARPTGTDG